MSDETTNNTNGEKPEAVEVPTTEDHLSNESGKTNRGHLEAPDSYIAPLPLSESNKTGLNNKKHLRMKGLFKWYWSWKQWMLPLTILVIIGIILLVPVTRYKVLGLFIKEQFNVAVIDSTTNTPISGAVVQADSISASTNSGGNAHLNIPVGNTTITISKQYYRNTTTKIVVSLSKKSNSTQVNLIATGRQVPVTVINLITGKGVTGAEIKVLDTEAKTDQNGKAVIVVPVSSTTHNGVISTSGYNDTNITLQVTSGVVAKNTFTITPSGKVYFLSKLSGKIDVIKTNLDGTDRQTVLAGTGNESDTGTVLLASRDWKYLALLTQRSKTGNPELDLIDTSTDQMSNIDEGNATFTVVGWSGENFIYQVSRNSVQNYQSGQTALKSFNAPNKKIILLDQTTASGSDNSNYLGESISNPYILSNEIVYTTGWNASYNTIYTTQLAAKQATLNTVQSDGTGKKIIKSFSPASGTQLSSLSITTSYPGPDTVYLDFYDGNQDSFYQYQNGQFSTSSDVTSSDFYGGSTYPTYLLSPSGNQTFWSEQRDGKNTLFTGDQKGNNRVQIATLSPYDSYGWYTDSYVLVSQNSSELFIMPMNGGTPIKITDYHKPSITFYGYGGGYGGR